VPAGIFEGNVAAAANPDTPLSAFQNAFFAPATGGLGGLFAQLYGFDAGALWFGQGPKRDYAYDGDVMMLVQRALSATNFQRRSLIINRVACRV